MELNKEIGKIAGQIVNKYGKSHGVKLADAFIAASSEYYNYKLWTLNINHYPSEKQRLTDP